LETMASILQTKGINLGNSLLSSEIGRGSGLFGHPVSSHVTNQKNGIILKFTISFRRIYRDRDFSWLIGRSLHFIIVRWTFLFRVPGQSFRVSHFLSVGYFGHDRHFAHCNLELELELDLEFILASKTGRHVPRNDWSPQPTRQNSYG
jgi:hypothetical protein